MSFHPPIVTLLRVALGMRMMVGPQLALSSLLWSAVSWAHLWSGSLSFTTWEGKMKTTASQTQRSLICLQTFPAICLHKEHCLNHRKATATLRQAAISNLCLLPTGTHTEALTVALVPGWSVQIVTTMPTSTRGPESTVHIPILLRRMC